MWRKIMVLVTALKTQINLRMCTQKTFQGSATVSKSSYDLYLAQFIKNPPAMWETWVRSLGWEDPLEKGKATHSSILA